MSKFSRVIELHTAYASQAKILRERTYESVRGVCTSRMGSQYPKFKQIVNRSYHVYASLKPRGKAWKRLCDLERVF